MLLNDRFVGSFGTVPPGDRSLIVKVAVSAARNGFAVVPMQDDAINPACALTLRDAKKDHECYHPLTEDTKVRAAFQRLTKDGKTCNLAIDIGQSNIGIATDVSWWEGPEISPTLIGLNGERIYVFDLNGYEGIVDPAIQTEGTLLVPPTTDDGGITRVELVGQLNHLTDNVPTETEEQEEVTPEQSRELWESRPEEEAKQDARIAALEEANERLTAQLDKLQQALVVGLTAMKELRDRKE